MTIPSHDMVAVAELMRDALHLHIMPYYKKLSGTQIIAKKSRDTGARIEADFATIADTEAEAFLSKALTGRFPGSRAVGEEAVSNNPAILKNLKKGTVIIIDPLDGTSIFRKGGLGFGILISLQEGGITRAGWILRTYTNAAGKLDNEIIMGERGKGVWHSPDASSGADFIPLKRTVAESNAKPLAIRSQRYFVRDLLKNPEGAASPQEMLDWAESGSAVDLYADLALSKIKVAAVGPTYSWDHAAGVFINRELGGTDRHLDTGRPYSPCRIDGGVIAAIDPAWLKTAMNELFITGSRRMKEPCIQDLLLPPSREKQAARPR